MIKRVAYWLDDRLGSASFAGKAMRKVFPDHWSFALGETALYCFVVLVATGVFLTLFFNGSGEPAVYHGPYAPLDGTTMSAAYESVLQLSFEVKAGLVMRQVHHWAALVFVAAIVVHQCRIFFTGAFRKPREINWMVGVVLLILAMLAGFSGYSLPDDLLSGTGVRIGYSVLLAVPVIGTWAAFLLAGGAYPSPQIIPRLLIVHVMILPALIIGAIALHLAIVWHQKHTQFSGPGRREDNVVGTRMWPNFALKAAGLAFCVFAVLGLLGGIFQINPVWLYGPYEPWKAASPAQPDWYMGWLEGVLRLAPNWSFHVFGHTIPEPFLPAVVFPLVFFLVIFFWPFIDQAIRRDSAAHNLLDRVRDTPWRTGVGVGVLTFAIILTLAGGNDVLGTFFKVPVETINAALSVLLVTLPFIAGLAAYWICCELRSQERAQARRPMVTVIRQTESGGYEEAPAGDIEQTPGQVR